LFEKKKKREGRRIEKERDRAEEEEKKRDVLFVCLFSKWRKRQKESINLLLPTFFHLSFFSSNFIYFFRKGRFLKDV
jgi:hypothetical protein